MRKTFLSAPWVVSKLLVALLLIVTAVSAASRHLPFSERKFKIQGKIQLQLQLKLKLKVLFFFFITLQTILMTIKLNWFIDLFVHLDNFFSSPCSR